MRERFAREVCRWPRAPARRTSRGAYDSDSERKYSNGASDSDDERRFNFGLSNRLGMYASG